MIDAHLHGHYALESTRQALEENHVTHGVMMVRHLPPTAAMLKLTEQIFTDSSVQLRVGSEFYCGLDDNSERLELVAYYRHHDLPALKQVTGGADDDNDFYVKRTCYHAAIIRNYLDFPWDVYECEFRNPAESHVEMLYRATHLDSNFPKIRKTLEDNRAELGHPMFVHVREWLNTDSTPPLPDSLKPAVVKFYLRRLLGKGKIGYRLPHATGLRAEELRQAITPDEGWLLLSVEKKVADDLLWGIISRYKLDGVCVSSKNHHCLVAPNSDEKAISPDMANLLAEDEKLLLVGSDFDHLDRLPGVDLTTVDLGYDHHISAYIQDSLAQIFA